MALTPQDRVRAVLRAARTLQQACMEGDRRAIDVLCQSGMSPALSWHVLLHHVEVSASTGEVQDLCRWVEPANVVHVALPSRVPTAVVRCTALAVAAASVVRLKPSRREAGFTSLFLQYLHASIAASQIDVSLVQQLQPCPGDHIHVYGHSSTIEVVASHFHDAHVVGFGTGWGLVAVDAASISVDLARAIVDDLLPFEQRGCMSPRVVLFVGRAHDAEELASQIAQQLDAAAERFPPGPSLDEEVIAYQLWKHSIQAIGQLLEIPAAGAVAVLENPRALLLPSSPRTLLVACVPSMAQAWHLLEPLRNSVSCLAGSGRLFEWLRRRWNQLRVCSPGWMQRPAFDGPVDLRQPLSKS